MVALTLNPSALVIILSWNYILAIHKIWIILRIIERLEDPGLQSDLALYFPLTIFWLRNALTVMLVTDIGTNNPKMSPSLSHRG